ncbi:Modifier of mdg4 [Operophtera brumata]|uniref:Modifier of mdg4 n=1 Tax=Operophtera brumata TaxID=104452 RepID=A0A0L7KWL4_OPEBR|nr:Modifier of mdg4 [Operophtera brumata]
MTHRSTLEHLLEKYKFISTAKSKHLLMMNNYTYCQMNNTRQHYCSSYWSNGCKARVKLDLKGLNGVGCKGKVKLDSNGKVIKADQIHSHEPPKYVKTTNYEFIPTGKGRHVLMMNKYTYYKREAPGNYYCSKNSSGCKAKVKLNSSGTVVKADQSHNHEPPRYMKTSKGIYILNKTFSDYEFIPSGNRKYLLMMNKYTYYQKKKTGNYYCSKNSSGCKAKVKLDSSGAVVKADQSHNHEPPRYMKTSKGMYKLSNKYLCSYDYEFIPSGKGKHLLMMNKYTYSQQNKTGNYYCSKNSSGCKAKVKLDSSGAVVKADQSHNHEPPRYMKTSKGMYIRILNKTFSDYEFIPSGKGKHLLMMNKYTYSQQHKTGNFYCSKSSCGCKAKVKLDSSGAVVKADQSHNHEPPRYMKTLKGMKNFKFFTQFFSDYEFIPTSKGKYLLMMNNYTYCQRANTGNYYCSKHGIGCKGKVKLDSNGKVLKADQIHNHEPPKYLKTADGKYIRISGRIFDFEQNFLDYGFIPTGKGKHLLMMDKYTYYQQNKTGHYYCSKKSCGCKAKVKLNSSGAVVKADQSHNHEPPHYEFIPTGKGKHLLMMNKYTYWQKNNTGHWYCSKFSFGCKGKVKFDSNGVVKAFDTHNHEPPQYIKTTSGQYVKV